MNPLFQGCKSNDKFIVITKKKHWTSKNTQEAKNKSGIEYSNITGEDSKRIRSKIEKNYALTFSHNDIKFIMDSKSSRAELWSLQEDIEGKKVLGAFPSIQDEDDDVTFIITPDLNIKIDTQGEIKQGAVTTKTVGDTILKVNHLFKIEDNFVGEVTKPDEVYQGKQKTINGEEIRKNEDFIIAVLDTGINRGVIPETLLWRANKSTSENGEISFQDIYVDDEHDYNKNPTNKIDEKKPILSHGTLVCLYILHELSAAPESIKNSIKLMVLKTHNDDGEGNLSTALSAIDFAVKNGACIINASWGYNTKKKVQPFLDALISDKLREKNVLFMAAAGNKLSKVDKEIIEDFKDKFSGLKTNQILDKLRDLDILRFYPACLSNSRNSVLAVTTTNGIKVSPRQNFSCKFVDLAITEGNVDIRTMGFRLPFKEAPSNLPEYSSNLPVEPSDDFPVTGSSYATAIATGIIAAHWSDDLTKSQLTKSKIFRALLPNIFISKRLAKQVRKGRYTTKR